MLLLSTPPGCSNLILNRNRNRIGYRFAIVEALREDAQIHKCAQWEDLLEKDHNTSNEDRLKNLQVFHSLEALEGESEEEQDQRLQALRARCARIQMIHDFRRTATHLQTHLQLLIIVAGLIG